MNNDAFGYNALLFGKDAPATEEKEQPKTAQPKPVSSAPQPQKPTLGSRLKAYERKFDEQDNEIRKLKENAKNQSNPSLKAENEKLKAENEALKKQLVEQNKTDVSESERESLLKLVLGMAIDAYRYDPNANRNPATGEQRGSIYIALDNLGLHLDADTIRGYIKEAKLKFPDIIPRKP